MRKIILSLIFLLFITLPALAVDYMPKYNSDIKNYGIGLYFGEGKATLYAQPDDKSHVIAKLAWDADYVYINEDSFCGSTTSCATF